MPSSAFVASLPFILRWEGGYVNHPADRGGATNKGVTQKVYDDWRTRQGLAARDVRQLEDAEMHAIYEAGYWLPPRCDLLQRRLDLVQFDTAVNMGVGPRGGVPAGGALAAASTAISGRRRESGRQQLRPRRRRSPPIATSARRYYRRLAREEPEAAGLPQGLDEPAERAAQGGRAAGLRGRRAARLRRHRLHRQDPGPRRGPRYDSSRRAHPASQRRGKRIMPHVTFIHGISNKPPADDLLAHLARGAGQCGRAAASGRSRRHQLDGLLGRPALREAGRGPRGHEGVLENTRRGDRRRRRRRDRRCRARRGGGVPRGAAGEDDDASGGGAGAPAAAARAGPRRKARSSASRCPGSSRSASSTPTCATSTTTCSTSSSACPASRRCASSRRSASASSTRSAGATSAGRTSSSRTAWAR